MPVKKRSANLTKYSGYSKIADSYINKLDQFQKLKDIANKKNYPHKIKLLQSRIQEEYNFWLAKEPSQKLLDIKKDLTFIQSQSNSHYNKDRIDILMEKYGYN